MEIIPREKTRTPRPFDASYRWTEEPWVNDETIRTLSHEIAYHIIVALAADVEGDDPQDEEDEQVFLLLNPSLTEHVWNGPMADEVVRHRVACAAAQGVDRMISFWISKYGSIDAGAARQTAGLEGE